MHAAAERPLWREHLAILVVLLLLSAAAWAVLVAGSGMSGMGGLTMGMGAPLFLALWVAMMVAMMFPTAAPMILVFHRVHATRRERGQAFVPTWLFVVGYLLVWSAFGLVAYALAAGAEALGLTDPRLGAGLVVLAGLYQLSPLKRACLANCRGPLEFIMTRWREGAAGAVRMGIEHGVYCLGCCWLLFLILIPLGMMNLVAMALIALLIFAEKSLPVGHRVAQAAALMLVAYGLLALAMPELLPAAMPSNMPM